jgi:hypothetical protein
MDTFTFNRQTIAFLGILALLEVLMVLLFPVLAIAAAVVAFFLMVFVWLKAGIRTRKWLWWNLGNVPLTQAEGAIAVSAALLFTCGTLVGGIEAIRYAAGERTLLTGYALRPMLRDSKPDVPARPVGMRGTHYSNPDTQMALKAELAAAGIPFKVETTDGKEFVLWAPEHEAAAEKIQQSVRDAPSARRSVHFDKPATQQEFKAWLTSRGIAHETTTRGGKEFVVWKEGSPELAIEFLKERHMPCPRENTAQDFGKGGQAPC